MRRALMITVAIALSANHAGADTYFRRIKPIHSSDSQGSGTGSSTPQPGTSTEYVSPTTTSTTGGPVSGGAASTGLVPPVAYTVASGALPPEVGIDQSTGNFTGNYGTPGTYDAVVQATDGVHPPVRTKVRFVVLPPPTQAMVSTQPVALVTGLGFSATLGAADGSTLTGWALTSGPAWLRLAPDTGVLSSAPGTATSTFSFDAVGYDAYGRGSPVSGSYTFAPARVSLSLPAAPVPGDAVTVRASSNLPFPTFTYDGAAPWMKLDGPGSVTAIVSQPSGTTRYQGSLVATQDQASATVGFDVTVQPVTVRSTMPSSVRMRSSLTGTVVASAGSGWTYSVAGAPAWMSVDPNGQVSGTSPASPGTFSGIVPTASRNGVSVPSSPISVTVLGNPVYATQPAGVTVKQGQSASTYAALVQDGSYVDPKKSWTVVDGSGNAAPAWLTASGCSLTGPTCSPVATPSTSVSTGSYGPYRLRMVDGAGYQLDSATFQVSVQNAPGMRLTLPNGVVTNFYGWTAAPTGVRYSEYYPGDGTVVVSLVANDPCQVVASKYPWNSYIDQSAYSGSCYSGAAQARSAWIANTGQTLPVNATVSSTGTPPSSGSSINYPAGSGSWSAF